MFASAPDQKYQGLVSVITRKSTDLPPRFESRTIVVQRRLAAYVQPSSSSSWLLVLPLPSLFGLWICDSLFHWASFPGAAAAGAMERLGKVLGKGKAHDLEAGLGPASAEGSTSANVEPAAMMPIPPKGSAEMLKRSQMDDSCKFFTWGYCSCQDVDACGPGSSWDITAEPLS